MERLREVEEKCERLQRLLAGERLGGVLLHAQHNFAWATAGGDNGVDRSREAGVGALLVRADGRRFLLANRIEMERLLAEQVAGLDCEPAEFGWEEEKQNADLYVERARALCGGGEVAADSPNGVRVIENLIAPLRYRLTDPELERFRQLGRDAGECVGELARGLEPGLTEKQVARQTVDALAARDIQALVALVGADERIERFRHPVPTDLRWRRTLMIVVCARRHGLIASLTRIVCAGAIPDELRRRTEACAQVNAELWRATVPGSTGAQLYDVAARAYAAHGFPGEEHLHHQGGAAGYRTREWVAHPGSQDRVEERQAFAWNPSITGTKTEETCIAHGDRMEVITASPGWEEIAVRAGGQDYRLPGVLSL